MIMIGGTAMAISDNDKLEAYKKWSNNQKIQIDALNEKIQNQIQTHLIFKLNLMLSRTKLIH